MAHVILPDPVDPGFNTLAREQMARWHIPGISIGVVHGYEKYFAQYGYARLDDTPMTEHSLFPVSGTTKGFTAAIMATVIQDPQKVPVQSPVRWDTPIATRLRADFVLSDEHATAVTTIEDALCHRIGLPNLQFAEVLRDPGLILEDLIRQLRYIPLAHDPDHRHFEYSNESYQVISHLLQRVTQLPLEEILCRIIWRPLGMASTSLSVDGVKRDVELSRRLVQGYTWDARSQQYIDEDYSYYAASSGANAVVSSVSDYVKWLQCLLLEEKTLSPAVHHTIKFPRIVVKSETQFDHFLTPEKPYHLYTVGWFLDSYRGEPLYWHTGSQHGAAVIAGFLPSLQFGFTIMATRTDLMYQSVTRSLVAAAQEAPSPWDYVRPKLPPSVPLHKYEGIYQHPGFGQITLVIYNADLYSDLNDRICRSLIKLNHLSAQFFVAEQLTTGGRWEGTFGTPLVEFEVTLYMLVERMAIYVPAFPGGKIWFARVIDGGPCKDLRY
ncbi:beta-lactamase/transpeptidase-like protein [Aspergillus taichungensis]|uniref:Beta-lactamase/transpeptidase-like protein n=1 Tax=Aspergillus taichungensis TaxID=482145 RepID=A0A2J5HQR9_9EURO|nr:beta-lactamase/transpeptidase-like protein [Aspergillus taichungensis]